MTEQEWLACTDPNQMLMFLRGITSERKIRLFGVACCYRIWNLIGHHEANRNGVAVAERYADGQATLEELIAANTPLECIDDFWLAPTEYLTTTDISTVCQVSQEAAWLRAKDVLINRVARNRVEVEDRSALSKQHEKEERLEQLRLLRDIFESPFRRISVDPQWLVWNNATVVKLAQAIYDERAAGRLPILADALEYSGCDITEILAHCRLPGPHVRGCWLIDHILGKK